MFKTNQFHFKLDPYDPSLITLELTKRSARNRRIKRLGPVVVVIGGLYAITLASEEYKKRTQETVKTPETPAI